MEVAERRFQHTKGRGLQPGVVPKNGLKPMTHGRLKPTLLSGSAGGNKVFRNYNPNPVFDACSRW